MVQRSCLGAVPFLIVTVVLAERKRLQLTGEGSSPVHRAIGNAARAVRPWHRRRAAGAVSRATNADGYPGLNEVHQKVAELAGGNRTAAEVLIRSFIVASAAAQRHDLTADHSLQMAIYDGYRDEGRVLPWLVDDAYLDSIKRNATADLLKTPTDGLGNLLDALHRGLCSAMLVDRTSTNAPERAEVRAESGRLTGIIEAFLKESAGTPPAVSQMVRSRLLLTDCDRRIIRARVSKTEPGHMPNLNYCEDTARGYFEVSPP